VRGSRPECPRVGHAARRLQIPSTIPTGELSGPGRRGFQSGVYYRRYVHRLAHRVLDGLFGQLVLQLHRDYWNASHP